MLFNVNGIVYYQARGASVPAGGSHPDLPMQSVAAPTADKKQEGSESTTPAAANFADFSKFDSFIQEQSSTNESQSTTGSSSANRSHRRSMSVDHVSVSYLTAFPCLQLIQNDSSSKQCS